MRTTKRFTASLLNRWKREGRGTGTFEDYQAWHRVSRSDPSSRGTSYIINYRKRQVHLLSRQEHDIFIFCIQIPNLVDMREQYPLNINEGEHEINDYYSESIVGSFPGTLEISTRIGFRHPKVDADNLWVMTTDMLLLLNDESSGKDYLLAVSVKTNEVLTNRNKELLSIEKEYWNARGVDWLLVTPRDYSTSVINWGRTAFNYFDDDIDHSDLLKIRDNFNKLVDKTHFDILLSLNEKSIDDNINSALWTAIWKGYIPLKISEPYVLHCKPEFINVKDFYGENPIIARRTSWI